MLELTDYAGKSKQVIGQRRPGNKGSRYPADPPRVEEIVAVMRHAGTSAGVRADVAGRSERMSGLGSAASLA